MDTDKKDIGRALNAGEADFVERLGEESWTYIKTVVDVMRESILILGKDLRVIAASEPFYQKFQVELKDTEKKSVYELGNGQWNIPALKKLLEDIIPSHSSFKGFEVAHEFPGIGRRVVILNGREIYLEKEPVVGKFPPIILLVIEDVTDMMVVAETLAGHANQLEAKHAEGTKRLEVKVGKLEREISELKKGV